ncbi:tail protein [Ruegeria sp. ANG-R]|uniref:tail protein X n=1 Tax=Ruegeria sp. ANG-R TaxID=1577903 RepID=UPI00057EDEBF|nr:tail protein X [Ruegeria sp. ANG-R]KIC42248.1 tail protein [Ruegeria sp. ANG-R]
MARTYTTGEGEALDLICQREYGRQAGAVERVLEANPTLKDVAHRLPRGASIILPDLNLQSLTTQSVRLWD